MEFEIKNVKCVTKKAGVSLVTVLLFMLVATIAATATYKWITSEGRSSATRMMEREAYQSSIAGIENARAWMTFHANETGALIRQYIYDLSTEGTDPANVNPKTTRTPINLDKHIRSFAQENSQNHHVWLVGVNTTPPTYKVKILSEGLSRDGRARHTEVAIFNVNGLYQVEKPKKTVAVESDLKFDYAYFGGSYLGAGNVTLSSAVVNGDWHGNPQTVTGNFVVTGNATLSGNSVTLGPLSCIGGNFYPQNNGATGKDFYIGGNAVGNITTTDEGNVYFDGDYANAEGGSVDFTGSVTLNGRLVPYPTLNFKIHGNLCTTNDGIVVSKAGSDANDKPFVVDGNVWMPGIQNVAYGNAVVTKQGCVCDISSPAWSDPPSIVQQNVSCDGEEKSYWNDGTYGNDSYKTIPTGCASIEKTIEMGDNHDFYQKILLGGAGKDVYIRSARKSADYSALAKNYSEEGKRNCSLDSRFKVIASNNWERDNNKGPFYKKMNVEGPYVCGTLYPPSTDGVHEYMTEGAGDNVVNHWTYYTDTWQSWTTATDAEVFPSHGSSSDKYYIFDNSVTQTNFVKFEQRTLNDWREIKSGATQQSDGKYHIPMWQSDNDKFDLYFNNSYPKVGAYKTGNQYFYDVTTDENNYYNYSNSKITGSPYCMNSSGDESKYRPSCGVTPWFKSNGKVYTKKDTWPIKPDFKCAEDVKENCKKIWGTKQASKKCGADYFVPDQIVTGFSKFKSFAQNECAKDIKYYGGETNDDKGKFVTDLNTCWRTLHNDPDKQKTALYNDFLVVEVCVHDQQKDACGGTRDVNPTGKLKGNFIIIINGGDKLGTNFMDIEDDDTHVFYYLKDGIGKIADATRRNTFIYSEGEIADGLQFNLTGTIYTAASTCAGLGSLQSSSITSDPTLNNLLANAGIICNNDGSACGGNMSSGTGSGTGATTTTYGTAGKDSYFISMAPQLGVTLESQYETSEAVPTVSSEDDELKKSFIVLPRIIYLTRDADGKLSDYYNIVPLNGANVTKNSATVSCSPSLNLPPSNLVTGDSKLDDGLYTCNATATGYSKVPFYVWVQGTQSSSPPVNFLEPAKTLDPGEPYEVKINLPPHATGISVKVNVSGNTEWITSSASTSAPEGSTYTFEFGADATGHSTPTIFTVTPPANTTNGVLVFSLLTPEPGAGYYLGNPWSTSLNIATTTTLTNTFDVTSTDIGTWCTAHASVCPGADVRSSWP
ncbi:MAG: pilus assembly PilX N-terminal domain-containing protein, partial [Fibrobacter sp.]|nr:pilus assembly PilX N-terminal domain-containing protein [Fibrobacter sp.]